MKNPRLANWASPKSDLLPDFIIGGAMKSGTTTLHHMLDQHPKVFIPKGEIRFFDLDNHLQHPAFNNYDKEIGKWTNKGLGCNKENLWTWYLNLYKGQESKVKGEDSTSYLASKIAAERIAIQQKKIKVIFLLRQPTKRCYSNYNHMLQKGVAKWSFEDTLLHYPFSILNRSLYKEQLENYYAVLPKEQIKVIIFEDFVKDTRTSLKEICEFLDLNFDDFPESTFSIHSNKARLPKNEKIHILKNRYIGNLKFKRINALQPSRNKSLNIPSKIIDKIYNKLNPQIEKRAPEINPETKKYLDDFFYKELYGIDELVGINILEKWFNR